MARKAATQRKPAKSGKKNLAASKKTAKASDPAHYRLEGTYERLRRALERGPDDGRVDQPLSYWVLPTDRRLPMAFLDWSVRDLIKQPLHELLRTPGVGRVKILGLFDLLRRVVKAGTAELSFGMAAEPPRGAPVADPGSAKKDPAEVSEAVWAGWCELVLRAGFGDHKLGRVAPCLGPLPTVIWDTPLREYAKRSLAEIRSLKTHGEKRVNAILGVFGAVYDAVSTTVPHEDLRVDVVPRFVPELTRWIVSRPAKVTRKQLVTRIAQPLIAQVEHDLGEPIARLTRERLALDGPAPTVIKQAKRLKVTRARVYQLLEECGQVMGVRWPEGRWLLESLEGPCRKNAEAAELLQTLRTLFYPD